MTEVRISVGTHQLTQNEAIWQIWAGMRESAIGERSSKRSIFPIDWSSQVGFLDNPQRVLLDPILAPRADYLAAVIEEMHY